MGRILSTEDRMAAGQALAESGFHVPTTDDGRGRADAIDLIEVLRRCETPIACLNSCRSSTGRMLSSPFAFFRGSAGLMAADLAGTAATGIRVQACGDCHLMNFGGFATPERNVIFDLNDFDGGRSPARGSGI